MISPCQGSHHQLPAEMGLFRLTRYSWRWRGADGPAWPRFQPDCEGGVGRAAGLVPAAGMHRRRAGATSLPSLWGLACMEGVETSMVGSLWSLSRQLLRAPWREMASVFHDRVKSFEKCNTSVVVFPAPSTRRDQAAAQWLCFMFTSKRNDRGGSPVLSYSIPIAALQWRHSCNPISQRRTLRPREEE